jgi:hypothetical protein
MKLKRHTIFETRLINQELTVSDPILAGREVLTLLHDTKCASCVVFEALLAKSKRSRPRSTSLYLCLKYWDGWKIYGMEADCTFPTTSEILRLMESIRKQSIVQFAVLALLLFWVVTSCNLVGRDQSFGGTYCPHLQGWSLPERWCLHVSSHGVTTQKNIFILISVRT